MTDLHLMVRNGKLEAEFNLNELHVNPYYIKKVLKAESEEELTLEWLSQDVYISPWHTYQTANAIDLRDGTLDDMFYAQEELNRLEEKYGTAQIGAYLDASFQTIMDIIEDSSLLRDSEYYPGKSLEDVAREHVKEGLYGEISPNLEPYLDYNSLVMEMKRNGWYDTQDGVIYLGK